MSRSQREYVLRQQMRTIREELGEAAEDDEVEQLRDRIARAELPLEAEKVRAEAAGAPARRCSRSRPSTR